MVATGVEAGPHRPFRALRHRDFRLLWLAYAVGDVGFWISYIALQWQMARDTGSDAGWLGLLFFTNFVPMLLLAPLAGVVADRVDRKALLVAGRAVVSAVSCGLAAVALAELARPVALLAFAAAFGSVYAFMAPAGQAVVANAVPAVDLASAVSLQSAGTNVARVAGPALAAPVLAAWGSGAAFVLYAVVNVFMLAVLVRLRLEPQPASGETGSVWARFRLGLDHARERHPALPALTTMAVFSVFGAAVAALYPVFATEVLGGSETSFTALVSASGVGAIAGALMTSLRRGAPRLAVAAAQLALFSVAVLGFALSRAWPLSLVLIASAGFFYFATTTTLTALLHHLADDDKRGRMMSLFTLTWAGLVPFGGLWMGAAAKRVGAPVAAGAGALVCLLFALGVLVRSPHLGTGGSDA